MRPCQTYCTCAQLHMALHVAVFFFFFFFFFFHNRLVRIIKGPDNRGPDNRGSTVLINYFVCNYSSMHHACLYTYVELLTSE